MRSKRVFASQFRIKNNELNCLEHASALSGVQMQDFECACVLQVSHVPVPSASRPCSVCCCWAPDGLGWGTELQQNWNHNTCDCTVMWIVLLGVQLIPKCGNVCPSAKESEDKENLPKRTSAGGFKFTFSHSASAANGANGANSKSVAAQTSPASSNGSSSKNTALSPAVPAPKVGELVWGCPSQG